MAPEAEKIFECWKWHTCNITFHVKQIA